MFTRAYNTFVTKTSFTLDSGITSLVLIPLPHAQESIEDIGPRLYGSFLGSAVLIPHETNVCPGRFFLALFKTNLVLPRL